MQGFDSFTYVHLISRRLIYAYLLFVSRPWAWAQNLQKRHSRKRHQHLLAPCASLNDSQLIFFCYNCFTSYHVVSRCIPSYHFVSICINLYLRSRLELQTLVSSASTRAARSPASLKLAPLAWLPCAWNKSPSWNRTPISQTSQMDFKTDVGCSWCSWLLHPFPVAKWHDEAYILHLWQRTKLAEHTQHTMPLGCNPVRGLDRLRRGVRNHSSGLFLL